MPNGNLVDCDPLSGGGLFHSNGKCFKGQLVTPARTAPELALLIVGSARMGLSRGAPLPFCVTGTAAGSPTIRIETAGVTK